MLTFSSGLRHDIYRASLRLARASQGLRRRLADAYGGYNRLGSAIRPDCRGIVLGPLPAQVSSNSLTSRSMCGAAGGLRQSRRSPWGGQNNRRRVRYRAPDQWLSTEEGLDARPLKRAPLVAALEGWMRIASKSQAQWRRKGHRLYCDALAGLLPLPRRRPRRSTHNAAQRALRGLALGRKSWLFAGSERGARAPGLSIQPAKLNDRDLITEGMARVPAQI